MEKEYTDIIREIEYNAYNEPSNNDCEIDIAEFAKLYAKCGAIFKQCLKDWGYNVELEKD